MKLKKYLFKSVTSTNDIAIRKIKKGFSKGIIVAKKQTKGRGRYGNKWIYLKNNLFMSVFFQIDSSENIKQLTSISCKIVKNSLLKLIKKKIHIKKPNDLNSLYTLGTTLLNTIFLILVLFLLKYFRLFLIFD